MRKSAWTKGVELYASEFVEFLEENNLEATEENLLNGAKDWREHSYGGCSLIYDYQIAKRLCSPSELKKVRGGDRQPNGRDTWLDCQARALYQAARIVLRNHK